MRPATNVCHSGVCGGADPANIVCLRADGIVDVGAGVYLAIFGYDCPSDVVPTLVQVRVDGAVSRGSTAAAPAVVRARLVARRVPTGRSLGA